MLRLRREEELERLLQCVAVAAHEGYDALPGALRLELGGATHDEHLQLVSGRVLGGEPVLPVSAELLGECFEEESGLRGTLGAYVETREMTEEDLLEFDPEEDHDLRGFLLLLRKRVEQLESSVELERAIELPSDEEVFETYRFMELLDAGDRALEILQAAQDSTEEGWRFNPTVLGNCDLGVFHARPRLGPESSIHSLLLDGVVRAMTLAVLGEGYLLDLGSTEHSSEVRVRGWVISGGAPEALDELRLRLLLDEGFSGAEAMVAVGAPELSW